MVRASNWFSQGQKFKHQLRTILLRYRQTLSLLIHGPQAITWQQKPRKTFIYESDFNINGYSSYRVSYFCNLLKNVKTNHDPLLAAVGVALLGSNSIRQMLVFLTQKPIFSSISYMRVLYKYTVFKQHSFLRLWKNNSVSRNPCKQRRDLELNGQMRGPK